MALAPPTHPVLPGNTKAGDWKKMLAAGGVAPGPSGGGRGRPQVTRIGEGSFNLPEGGGEANIEDEVSKAAAGPGTLDGPGHIPPAVNDEPGVSVCPRKERAKVTVTEVALDNGRLGHHREEGALKLGRSTN